MDDAVCFVYSLTIIITLKFQHCNWKKDEVPCKQMNFKSVLCGFIFDFLLKSSNWHQIDGIGPCVNSNFRKRRTNMMRIHLRQLIRCTPLSWPNNVSRRPRHSWHSGHHHWQRGPPEISLTLPVAELYLLIFIPVSLFAHLITTFR